jgi:hypothetical protein
MIVGTAVYPQVFLQCPYTGYTWVMGVWDTLSFWEQSVNSSGIWGPMCIYYSHSGDSNNILLVRVVLHQSFTHIPFFLFYCRK